MAKAEVSIYTKPSAKADGNKKTQYVPLNLTTLNHKS